MYTLLRFPILVACILLSAPSFRAAPIPEEREATNLSVTPEVIRINAFYKGTDVEVSADLPIDCTGAVVKIQGDDEEITLKRKGRVYFFWLNIDDVTISDAPDVYILNSSIPLDRLRAVDPQHTLLLGYDALKEHINIRCKNALSGSEFSEFIKLKEHNGSYQENATAQLLPAAGKTHNSFKAVLHIPPVMPSGEYRILLYYFLDGVLSGESSTTLSVEKVGIPNYLYSLAFNHPAAYGLFACIIAMATGILTGLIFGSQKRRKH